jgi:pimeloyl-ACP methyl ester carboxylesterase
VGEKIVGKSMESLTFFGVSVEYFGPFQVQRGYLCSFHFGVTLEFSMNLQTFTRHAENEQAQSQELEPPASARLGEIQTPTLVMIGDQDVSSVQAIADRLAAAIPGARKVVMPNTAHVPNMEQPEAFNQIVFDFLASLGW